MLFHDLNDNYSKIQKRIISGGRGCTEAIERDIPFLIVARSLALSSATPRLFLTEAYACKQRRCTQSELRQKLDKPTCHNIINTVRITTCCRFFTSLNANSAKSFCGTSFCFGSSFASPIRI